MLPLRTLVLCSTLHDPSGSLLLALEKAAPLIKRNYAHWIIAATKTTDERIIEVLKQAGFNVVFEGSKKLSSDPIEDNHLLALDRGLEFLEDGQSLQYTDGDRIVYGAAYFPEIFEETVEKIEAVPSETEYVSLTRSADDNQSHHNALVMTEQYITAVYQQALGEKVDPCSTAHVFSQEAVEFLLQNTDQHGVMKFPHGKWAVLMKEGGFNIQAIETSEILSFETPLQFHDVLTADAFIDGSINSDAAKELRRAYQEKRLPSLEALREYYLFTIQSDTGVRGQASKEEWKRRCDLAEEWVSFLNTELKGLRLSEAEQDETRVFIEETLRKVYEIRMQNVEEKPVDSSMGLKLR